ncbi:MAG: D-alanyl-D-alanine carboxypeptidase family protein, partial [Candidatus Gallimonas sp.]
MKKYLCLFGAALAFGCVTASATTKAVAFADELNVTCKAAYLCDFDSGTQVYAKNETKRLPIASMCKIMTLLLSFEAVDEGSVSYDEQITIGENASGMGGSQVFLQTNLSYSAAELMKTVAVCSANDSCVALAERIAGTESAFVEKMNKRAKELGANNTLFANCTGLPKEPQYSCAKDVAVMLRELLKQKKYFEFSKIWLEDFAHPDGRTTRITNTNKLVRFYEGCDGGKTGYTSEAGFCLAATAKRGETRLVSVVIGSDNSKKRFAESKDMLNYAFNCYENRKILEAGKAIERKLPVKGSKTSEVDICAENNLSAFVRKGETGELNVEYVLPDEAKAPLSKGDCVGEAVLYRNGIEIARTRLTCMQNAARFSWWEAMREGSQNWN